MIAVFANQDALDEVKPKLPSGVIIGTPLASTDGRVAICHPFVEVDQEAIVASGGQLMDSLPDDWHWPETDGAA